MISWKGWKVGFCLYVGRIRHFWLRTEVWVVGPAGPAARTSGRLYLTINSGLIVGAPPGQRRQLSWWLKSTTSAAF